MIRCLRASDSATREEATFSMIWEPDGEVIDRSFMKCHAIPGQFEEASHAASTKQEGVDGSLGSCRWPEIRGIV